MGYILINQEKDIDCMCRFPNTNNLPSVALDEFLQNDTAYKHSRFSSLMQEHAQKGNPIWIFGRSI